MNKFLNLSILLFAIFDLSSNSSLEITTIEIQESYNIIQNFPGKILPLNYSKLAFEVPGKIQQVKIDIGDAVKKGDILAFLDPSEMQANLNQAQARFDLAEQALKRFQDLKSKGFISNQELDRANSEFLIAKAQVDLYSVKLEQTYIRAPFDGYIQNRFLDSGTVISQGVPILEIIDSSFVEAHVSVPSNVIEGLMEGESYSFLIGMEIFPATFKRYTKMSGQGSDNRLCIFEFNTFISPGSVSYLQLRQKKIKTGAWVPLKSLSQGTQGLWNLYTVSKDNNEQYKVAKEIVELIHVEGDNAYISGTISTGDMVVSGGAEKVIENEILKVN
ncbi:efflux RND transporter periplasmic adaptor subunit [Gammaproteobacteria bacterium]|nr:efflux RND transporter periplasmic adaptor subunit [Gammaproteobacteria bacterium]